MAKHVAKTSIWTRLLEFNAQKPEWTPKSTGRRAASVAASAVR